MAKEKSESELLFGEYYLIDEKKCLYKSIEDDGIYYREKGGKMFSRQNPRSAEIVPLFKILFVHCQ